MKKMWQKRSLGEICIVDWGNTDLTKSAYVQGGKYLAVSAAGCDGRIGHNEHAKHTPVLSAIGAQCGKMFLPEEDFTAIKNTITLTPRPGLCSGKFLYQLLTYVELPKRGAAQPFIAKGDIQNFVVSLPSLSEQQRIVEVLDKAWASLAIAQANAEKNLQNASALFESHLQSVFIHRSKGWVEMALGDCLKVRSGDFLPAKAMVEAGKIDVYGGNGVSGRHNSKNLTGQNIVIGRVGAKCGNVHHVVGDAWVTDNALLVSEYHRPFDLRFLATLLRFKDLRSRANQMAQPVISFATIKDVQLKFPESKVEQSQIADQLDALAAETQRLARLYEQKLAALSELKKSLLHQAFTGEL